MEDQGSEFHYPMFPFSLILGVADSATAAGGVSVPATLLATAAVSTFGFPILSPPLDPKGHPGRLRAGSLCHTHATGLEADLLEFVIEGVENLFAHDHLEAIVTVSTILHEATTAIAVEPAGKRHLRSLRLAG